ncbi:hypothetical protein AMATHDRAFT_9632 [Amanita thiersii Skay4041]|uniref:Uncharacterized protein n=1 Tax=Amanita thiersii Skay4041 TaxID=703135 RepID=A0A2A9N792_9AGAR|nr:hypothetical protein AMATHDRAFT_9632 [Amanita thiersii Skay4041]
MKDFDYYVQHAKDQLTNPSVPREKKTMLKTIIKDAEKWQPKHWVDDDRSILPDSPPPSPIPKPKTKSMKQKDDTRKAAELSRKGNTPTEERKMKEELYCEAANICTLEDKDLIQLQLISSLTDSNKKCALEETSNQKKQNFEDYLNTKDFEYYVQHTREQITNLVVPSKKKETLKHLVTQVEQVKWSPKHLIDEDRSVLPDSPPPSPPPKTATKTNTKKTKTNSKQETENTRKGNTPNTRHLQKLLNDMNKDNGMKIMDKLANAKQKLIKPETTTKAKPQSYAQKTSTNPKDLRKDGAGGWKTVGNNNKISRATILPPPPNVFKFFVTDDKTTLPSPKQTDEELTDALNNIISENVEWLLALGSNHVKSANWSKDPKAIVVTMTHNIDKNRENNLPDGKTAFEALCKVVLDLFLDATLANRKPRSKLRFPRVPLQHSDGLPMDNGLLYHYLCKHPNFENIRFSLTPQFERQHPLRPGQNECPMYSTPGPSYARSSTPKTGRSQKNA